MRSDARENPIHENTKEGINNILNYGHEVDDYRLPSPQKNPCLQEIITNQYIKRDGNGVEYTIVGPNTVDQTQKNLTG